MLKKKNPVIQANLVQMRKRAHHRELLPWPKKLRQLRARGTGAWSLEHARAYVWLACLSQCFLAGVVQLSNYHACNFQFKTYFGSGVYFGFHLSAWLQGFLQRVFFFFYSFVYSLLVCQSDVALHWNKCLTTIKLTKKWLTSPIEAFHVEKSPKKWTKIFAGGIFRSVLWRIFFWPGQQRNVQRICLQSFKVVPFLYLEFLPKEGHSTMMDRHSSSPKAFLRRLP